MTPGFDVPQMLVSPESDLPALKRRAAWLFEAASEDLAAQVSRMFAWLLAAEWLGMVAAAAVVAPRTWIGDHSAIHPHLLAAIFAGPAFIFPAIAVALLYPSREFARHVIAVAQILVSILLIDVTGGRIETHFHIFGSLAFLAFYRDWRVLVTASALTGIDHLVRGIWWPQSVYGVLTVSPWRWVEHVWWVLFEDFFLFLGSRRSVAEMRAVAGSKAQLEAGAYHDVLTGLANRRLLQENFDAKPGPDEVSGGAILFIDLDRFKQANDTLGHAVGDKLLKQVAARLSGVTREKDTLARIGGDEFVLFLPGTSGEREVLRMGDRILAAIAPPFLVEGHELLLSASVGISIAPRHGSDLATLQERADRAMYVAKSRGRNRCEIFSTEVAERENRMKEIGRDLYKALSEGELRLYFQPLVRANADVIGFEALLRWEHPVYGEIAPSDFIPLAERSGLIVKIGEWVMREACRNCALWQRQSARPLSVAVNVSAVQFEQAGFAGLVMNILRETGLEHSRLTLELTESVLLKDPARASVQFAALREQGVRIALDDFGTGYSSLSYLVTLPADTIKLDRTFVNREFENASAVIESVIEMAHRVGLRVVGEGVETQAQNDRLLRMNCDEMQGFFFSRPMPAAEVEEFIESKERELIFR